MTDWIRRNAERLAEEQQRLIRDGERLEQLRELGTSGIRLGIPVSEIENASAALALAPSSAEQRFLEQHRRMEEFARPARPPEWMREALQRDEVRRNAIDRRTEIEEVFAREERLREVMDRSDRMRQLESPSAQIMRDMEERQRVMDLVRPMHERAGVPRMDEAQRIRELTTPSLEWQIEPVELPDLHIPENPAHETNALLLTAVAELESANTEIADLRAQVAEERKELAAEREALRRSSRKVLRIGIAGAVFGLIGCALMAATLYYTIPAG